MAILVRHIWFVISMKCVVTKVPYCGQIFNKVLHTYLKTTAQLLHSHPVQWIWSLQDKSSVSTAR